MKKSLFILSLMSLLLFVWAPIISCADSAGTQGDLTFVGGDESSNEGKNEQSSEEGTKLGGIKPSGSMKFPSTGEKEQMIWIVTGAIVLVVIGSLLIIKKLRRSL